MEKTTTASPTTFEGILLIINANGLWQRLILAGGMLIMLFSLAFPMYQQNYLLANRMQYRCADDSLNATFENATTERDECLRADGSACTSWTYQSDYFDSTLVSEWNLVCGRAYLAPLYKSAQLLGSLAGLVLFGVLADLYGRWLMMAIMIPLQVATYFVTATTTSYAVAVAMRMAFGFVVAGAMKGVGIISENEL